jgi:NADPH-dependent curcumin reductase CurA
MEPKAGEILVVNGAAGAVGSTVGQLAKLKAKIILTLREYIYHLI